MTIHEAVSNDVEATVPCTSIFCAPHYFVKLLLIALFAGVVGSWAYCAAGQPASTESSLDMSNVSIPTVP
jgi:hypothetical protein